ncbi:uncharacterized protein TA03960 [Theileria annulata]|uniref:Uncharacterized protein n=1 Tax=Theileria annulata TaxID=5874 RepID=Q4UCB3_THEAN|nr:uncharacterized protein TA03960 [Theileria annulata]CAI75538.1 hypothetical protein, conserved [Theileria annulata]|eukprot:XP_955014.1 hypothetical protein, conserved [Theileria annulata]
MAKPAYKDLGISSKEYEEALLLERLFRLVKKNPCSTCLLKKPTHVDLDRYDLLCTTCSKRCSSKVQIGKGLISMSDLERLESIYDKSKKKKESKHKKHGHKSRSSSVSRDERRERSPEESHRPHRSKHSKRRESGSGPSSEHYPPTDKYPPIDKYYPEPMEKYPPLDKYYPEPDRYYGDSFDKSHTKGHREKSKERSRKHRNSFSKEYPRDYAPRSHLPEYNQYNFQEYRFGDPYNQFHEPYQPNFYNKMKRNQTAQEYTNFSRRDVPGMVGILANRPDMVIRNQYALPPPNKTDTRQSKHELDTKYKDIKYKEDTKRLDKRFDRRYDDRRYVDDREYGMERNLRSKSLALTNGFQAFKSMPVPMSPFGRDEIPSTNPFSKRNFPHSGQAFHFTSMREALNPPTHSRIQEHIKPSHDFNLNKFGNPNFPDSNNFSRY